MGAENVNINLLQDKQLLTAKIVHGSPIFLFISLKLTQLQ